MRNDITEDYPSSWNKEEFKNITSFQQKMNYANQRLEKLATGSGRAVFKIDEQKVLKIAKNKKGLAQNNIESEPHTQNYDITAHTYDVGEVVKGIGPFWVEMELAKKLTPSKFKQLTGLTHITYSNYLFYLSLKNRFKNKDYELDVFSNRREIENNQFVQDIIRFADDYDMVYGDLRRLSSYGVVYRAGNEKIVLVDYGLTTQVHDDYYKVKF